MAKILKTALATLGALGLLVVPAVTLSAPPSTTYNTTLEATDQASKIAYYFGSLQLTVGSDGVVHGWYLPQYDSTYTPVTGSYKAGKYWLTIGNGQFQVYATKQADGSLAGSATNTAIAKGQPLFPPSNSGSSLGPNPQSSIAPTQQSSPIDSATQEVSPYTQTLVAASELVPPTNDSSNSVSTSQNLYPQTFQFYARPTHG